LEDVEDDGADVHDCEVDDSLDSGRPGGAGGAVGNKP